jgi:hypothetical protein
MIAAEPNRAMAEGGEEEAICVGVQLKKKLKHFKHSVANDEHITCAK